MAAANDTAHAGSGAPRPVLIATSVGGPASDSGSDSFCQAAARLGGTRNDCSAAVGVLRIVTEPAALRVTASLPPSSSAHELQSSSAVHRPQEAIMGTQHILDHTPYRLTYTVRGRTDTLHMEQFGATRRAAEIAALPVLAASWQVAPHDIAVTGIEQVSE
jgi:hypothetical protein